MAVTDRKSESSGILYLIPLCLIVFAVILIKSAWVSDDAYITVRTVDNLYHGFGLTWNAGERVQAYTHPLWMLLLAAVYFSGSDPYYLLLGLSLAISLAAAYLLLTNLAPAGVNSVLGLLLLISSKAFIDYSTSGLENPLTHLIYVVFILLFLQNMDGRRALFFLSLTAALGTLNRDDTILLFLPALVYAAINRPTKRALLDIGLGFSPFILWELFSLFYYGFFFPNTAYAKLNTGISSLALLKQGLLYVLFSISRDPGSVIIILLGLVLAMRSRDWRKICLALGMILYLMYVIRIGGDFMAGRYFSVLMVGAVAFIVNTKLPDEKLSLAPIAAALVIIFAATPNPPILYNAGDETPTADKMGIYNGIEDERLWYYPQTGLLTVTRNEGTPALGWEAEGLEARRLQETVLVRASVGVFGYYAGPGVYVVDHYALGDPLLARLKTNDRITWRIGHFARDLPKGYRESLETHQNKIRDPNLAVYYDKLSIITKGNLLDWGRIGEIIKMNSGYYQSLLDAYQRTQP